MRSPSSSVSPPAPAAVLVQQGASAVDCPTARSVRPSSSTTPDCSGSPSSRVPSGTARRTARSQSSRPPLQCGSTSVPGTTPRPALDGEAAVGQHRPVAEHHRAGARPADDAAVGQQRRARRRPTPVVCSASSSRDGEPPGSTSSRARRSAASAPSGSTRTSGAAPTSAPSAREVADSRCAFAVSYSRPTAPARAVTTTGPAGAGDQRGVHLPAARARTPPRPAGRRRRVTPRAPTTGPAGRRRRRRPRCARGRRARASATCSGRQPQVDERAAQALQPLVEAGVALLDQAVGVEHQRAAGRQGAHGLGVGARQRAQRRPGLDVEEGGLAGEGGDERRRVAGGGHGQRAGGGVQDGDEQGRELEVEQDVAVGGQPRQQGLGAVALQGERRDDGPQLAHAGGAAHAVPHDVAHGQQQPVADLHALVPVAADERADGAGQVARGHVRRRARPAARAAAGSAAG